MTKEVTIRDVASLAGVSLSTVSMVINQRPGVSAKMLEKILAAMQELGYEAAPRARMVRPGGARPRRTKRVAMVLLGLPRALLSGSIYSEIVSGAEEALREQGYSLLLLCVPDQTRLDESLDRVGFDGLLVLGEAIREDAARAAWRHPCVRVLGVPEKNAWYDHIYANHVAAGLLAAEYLLGKGHRECAFFGRGEGDGDSVFQLRKEAFLSCVRDGGGSAQAFVDDDLVEISENYHGVRRERLAPLMERVLSAKPRLTGLFLDADTIATAVYQYLYEKGIHPGEHIQIVTCNNEKPIVSNLHPLPAVVDLHAHVIGRRAVDQLLWRMQNRDASRMSVVMEPSLIPAGA